jgi:hypothetical protein
MIRQPRSYYKASSKQPEDGGNMFFRNVDLFSTDYKVLCPTICKSAWSWESAGRTAKESMFDSWQREEIFIFFVTSKLALGPTNSYTMGRGGGWLFPWG